MLYCRMPYTNLSYGLVYLVCSLENSMKRVDDEAECKTSKENLTKAVFGNNDGRCPTSPGCSKSASLRVTSGSTLGDKRLSFTRYTKEDYSGQVQRRREEEHRKEKRKSKPVEGRIVDGRLTFDNKPTPQRDPKLIEGNVLCDSYGDFPTRLYGKPLNEIDSNIFDKTFVVIAKRFKKKLIYRFSSTPSFFYFTPWNPVRRLAVYIVTNQFFDYFIMLTILVNCFFLCSPEISELPEYIFFGIYVFEMIAKLLARGFFINQYTYLRDSWNWLDFIVILLACVTIIIQAVNRAADIANVAGLRTFRVLRALRTVSIAPGLKTIVNALLRAFKMLVDVIILTVFCLMIFALFGLQVYMGVLRHKCIYEVPNYTPTAAKSYHDFYRAYIKNSSNWLKDDSGDYKICGNITGSGSCPTNYTCIPDVGENPNFGYTNFDHFGWSMLTSFQLITLDFWEDVYNKVLQASGPWNVIFFVVVVFFGSFYLVNLMLAVVAMSYEEEAENTGKENEHVRKFWKKKNPLLDLKALTVGRRKELKQHNFGSHHNRTKTIIVHPESSAHSLKEGLHSPQENSMECLKNASQCFVDGKKFSADITNLELKDDGKVNSVIMVNSATERTDDNTFAKDQKKLFIPSPLSREVSEIQEKEIGALNSHMSSVVVLNDEVVNMEGKPDYLDQNCESCQKCSFYVPWLRIQNFVYDIVSDPFFDVFITCAIILNTVFMSLEHHGMSTHLKVVLKVTNYIFIAVFLVEALLKIMAFSKSYFSSGWNVFDLVIVIASLVDLSLEGINGLSVFRTFRLLRVFKLAQSWTTMRILLTIIINTLGALGNLTFILVIVVYIFAVIGLQLFHKTYTKEIFNPDPVPRWNFNDFFHSFMMVFRILCGEWIEPLWDCMRASNELCMVVFIPTIVLGNFIVLNLFLAMLLNSFATDSLRKHKESYEESRFFLAWQRVKNRCLRHQKVFPETEKKEQAQASSKDEKTKEIKVCETEEMQNECQEKAKNNGEQLLTQKLKPMNQSNGIICNKKGDTDAFEVDRSKYREFSKIKDLPKEENANKISIVNPENEQDKTTEDSAEKITVEERAVEDCISATCSKRWPFEGTVFGRKWHTVRKTFLKIIDHKLFESVILVIILASSITLAFEDVYLPEKPKLQSALYFLNIIFCVLFLMEMFLKWIALGLKCYFTHFWTLLDFSIVLISIASIIAEATGIDKITAFRSLRTLRALRPLRAISRWQGMKIVVNALMLAIPSIFNVLLVCFVFWLIFSIMGVQFFAGKFYKCIHNGVKLSPSIVANKNECLAKNFTWRNSNVNFDSVGQGYLALFQVATYEGWMEIMADAVDSTQIDQQPSFENSLYSYLYFVAFIIFGSFFTLNLFIGVIIDNFNVLKKKIADDFLIHPPQNTGLTLSDFLHPLALVMLLPFSLCFKYEGSYLDMFLTPSQRTYYNTLKKLGNKKPQKTIKRPNNKFLGFGYDVAISNKFELAIVMVIFLNMAFMAIEHYNQSEVFNQFLNIVNNVFTTIFSLEVVVKIIGLRWYYFQQAWNVFDFVIVILSIVGAVLHDLLSSVFVTPTLLRVARVFRIGRILRLIKAAKGMRKLLFALIISLPALFNVGALLFLVMYIYAIIGMSSFSHVRLSGALNDVVNFQTFGNSFLILVRLATSAGWNDVLEPLLVEPPKCDPVFATLPNGTKTVETNGDCGITWLAVTYMVTYIIIIFLIVINMYIAVILENFNQAHEQEEVGITDDDFDMFYAVWEQYDPLATQFIKSEQLSNFVADLMLPLGVKKPNDLALVSFNLPIVEGEKVHCLDVLMALVKRVLGDVEETEEFKQMWIHMESKFEKTFPTRVKTVVISNTLQRKKEEVAAKTLQHAWKQYRTRKQIMNITSLAVFQQESISRNVSPDLHSTKQ